MELTKRVFISYAHESEEHKERVLQLCGQLRQSGLDAWIDQYETFPPQGWPMWMHQQIKIAQFALVVCSEKYRARFEGDAPAGEGKGAKWEGAIVSQLLYDCEQNNKKFIPIVVNPTDAQHTPTLLRQYTRFDVSSEQGLDSLYRLLTDQPSVVPPPVGDVRTLPSKNHVDASQPRVQGKITFTSSSTGWTILLKVANVSDVPLYLENPQLSLTQVAAEFHGYLPKESQHESSSVGFLPVKPVTGPLLPTQQRIYFLPPEVVPLLQQEYKNGKTKPSIKIATAVKDELVLEDTDTAETILTLLGHPVREGRHGQYFIRMPLILRLVHKRCTDQANTGFKVYPPKEILDDKDILKSDDIVERLHDKQFTIVFSDGDSESLNTPELVVFVQELIFVAAQMREITQQLDKAGIGQPVNAFVNTNISVEQTMQSEIVKLLLEKIEFESTTSPTGVN